MGKLPPQAVEIELALLGMILLEQDSAITALSLIKEDVFYKDVHRIIFIAIKNLFNRSEPIDLLTVKNELKRTDQLEEVGGAYFITTLTNAVASSANIEYYCRILTQNYIKRKQIQIGNQAIIEAYDNGMDVFESINNLENNISELNGHIIGNEVASNIQDEAEETYQYLIKPREEKHTGIKTGNENLTNILGGWNKGELVVICGRPGHAKTTRAIQFAIQAAFEGHPTAFFSIEMKKASIHQKMFANVSNVDDNKIREQNWDQKEINDYWAAKERIRNSKLFLCDLSVLRPNNLRTICRERKRKHGLELVIVDYLQLMQPNTKGYSREADISSISGSLKVLAKELDIPVIALAQISRDCEKRNNKRPILSDLRESGAIEQDADIVLSLYSPYKYYTLAQDPDYNCKDSMDEDAYELISEIGVLKNRMGGSGMIFREHFYRSKSLFV